MKLLQNLLLILLAFSYTCLLRAQENEQIEYSNYPLKISLGNHAVGFPFQNSFDALNPHISLGTEKGLNKSNTHRPFIASSLGLIINKFIGNTITLDLDLGYRFTAKGGLYLDMALGLGILNQFHPNDIYIQNATDGSFQKVNDNGRLSSLISLKTGFGYDFSRKTSLPFSIGISHDFFIQTSYFDVANFPIMPQSTTNILITYKFKKP